MTLLWSEAAIATMALGLLAVSALSDVAARIIPNWACLGIFLLFFPFAFFSPGSVNLVLHFASFAGVFAVTFLLWHRGILGGGDVKLLSALAIWCNLHMLGPFLIVVTVTGGFLAIGYVSLFVWLPFLVPFARPLASAVARSGPAGGEVPAAGETDEQGSEGEDNRSSTRVTVPYGVAIAAGGVWVILQHVPLIG